MNEISNESFFIVSSDRSGSTLLRLMLNEHPRLRVPRESRFLVDLMDNFEFDKVLSDEDLHKVKKIVSSHHFWKKWETSNDCLQNALLSLHKPLLKDAIDAIFINCSNMNGKSRWGDKTPKYITEILRLHKLFPDSKFIHIIRDGRDVSLSLSTAGWKGSNIVKRAHYWNSTVKNGIVNGRKLGNDLYLEISYEDLILDTENTLRKVCIFLGEHYFEQMHNYYESASIEIAPGEENCHAKTTRPPETNDVRRYQHEMSPYQIAVFEFIAGDCLDLAGQQRQFPWLRTVSPFFLRPLRLVLSVIRPVRDQIVGKYPKLRKHI